MKFATQGLLEALGRRIRARRAALAHSVTAAADGAGVSRRTWTEIEAGRANPSIVVLARVAAQLRTPLSALFEGLGGARAGERIALVGVRGAGKSTVGALLAQRLDAPFVELDERVERTAGLSLAELFDLHGADSFHHFEREALEGVLAGGERQVLATGGSIVDAPETYDRLLATCRTVWLAASPEVHMQRVRSQGDARPMQGRPQALEQLRRLLARREPAYARAELVVATDALEPEQVATRVLDALHAGPRRDLTRVATGPLAT
ncbi:MAG: shikimate kinase [Planctomycetota bacterium]